MKHISKIAGRIIGVFTSIVMTCSLSMTVSATKEVTDNLKTEYLQCDHVEELSDGGKIYVYYINGIENTFPVPPNGFNPVEAPDDVLATYGFPPRPTDAKALEKWNKDMSAYKYTPVPEIKLSDIVYGVNQPVKSKEDNSAKGLSQTTGSSNWSGYVAKGNYVMMQADFIQPSVNASDPYYTNEGTWIGFGGYSSHKLVQTGTGMGKTPNGNYYYAWYELISPTTTNPPVAMTSVSIHPGDNIHLYCSFQQANNKFNAYVANNTTGVAQPVLVNNISASDYFDSSTAEFINEKPSVLGTDNGLSNYVTTNWSNCQVYSMSNVWYNLGSTTYDRTIMYNTTSGDIRAVPSGLSGKTFTSTWYNY